MPKLTDTHRVVLSAAAQHDDGVVLPLPASLTLNKRSAASVLKGLIRKGLIAERPAPADAESWREDADGERVTLVITDAGLSAIGVEAEDAAYAPPASTTRNPAERPENASSDRAAPEAKAGTKQALLIDLLKRKDGATIEEVTDATGWQAHSVRGAISGMLKKKLGLPVTSEKVEGRGRVYRIVGRD